MRDKKTKLIKVERVDDIPVSLQHRPTMQVAALLNQHFAPHGNWAGKTTLGEGVVGWLSFIVSEGDHGRSQVPSWAQDHPATRSAGLGKAIRPLDFPDDRLADRLDARSKTEPWNDSLTPRYRQEDQRTIGWVRRLSIAWRVLTRLEFVVRRQLEPAGHPLKGWYAGNPQRATARPTAKAILRTFRGLSLVVEEVAGQGIQRLTPLNPLQQRLLRLLGMPVKIDLRLTKHFQKLVPI